MKLNAAGTVATALIFMALLPAARAQQAELMPQPAPSMAEPERTEDAAMQHGMPKLSPQAALAAGEMQAQLEPDTNGLNPAAVRSEATQILAANPVPQATASPLVYVYEFSASWCPSCRKLKPIVEQAAAKYRGFAQLVPVNVDRNQNLTRSLNVAQIPTVMVVDRSGRMLNRLVGLQQGEQIDLILDHYRKQSMASVPGGTH